MTKDLGGETETRKEDSTQALISRSNVVSELDRSRVQGTGDIPYGTDKYVVLALLRLCEGRHIRLPKPYPSGLSNFIRGRTRSTVQGGNVYPVVSVENGNVSFGRSRR